MKLFIVLSIILTNIVSVFGQTPANDPHWHLDFVDNFNILNTGNWLVKNNFDHFASTKPMDSYERDVVFLNKPSNVRVENGILILQLNKEDYTCPPDSLTEEDCSSQAQTGESYKYTAGYLETKYQDFDYGYIEARIKLPDEPGLITAFWTFTKAGLAYNEIDIFEMVPGSNIGGIYNNKYTMTSNIITADYDDRDRQVNSISDYTEWHTYGVEWSPTRILIYVDDELVRFINRQRIVNPERIIFDIAISGWLDPSQSNYPSKMYVDWLRHYSLRQDCIDINSCNFDFNSYSSQVKNKIHIGGEGCQNTINGDIVLRASSEIQLEGEFTVSTGSTLVLDVNSCY
ncbi:MAG TPA: glycoside hydrolase family 16 protein [Bacteroidales bacterium]|nr:glycoside hydrolase family 16 protein [Bacteroidales bacterium]